MSSIYLSRIPDYCKTIMDLINQRGFEAYVVGGAVRDMVMGFEPQDFDIATSANPKEVVEILNCEGISNSDDYSRHGTIIACIDSNQVEITSYRIDGKYSDVRRPDEVLFSRNIEDDCSRRDFTMNSLYLDSNGIIVDHFGGVEDISNKIIRCVGDSRLRFEEDALRILRGLRFEARLGFSIDPETKAGMLQNLMGLTKISKERIAEEFTKIITGKFASKVIRENVDILAIVLPELKDAEGFDQKTKYHDSDCLEHTLRTIDNIPLNEFGKREVELSYAALFHDICKPQVFTVDSEGVGHMKGHPRRSAELFASWAKEHKLSKKMTSNIETLIRYHDTFNDTDQVAISRMMAEIPNILFDKLEILQEADILAHANYGLDRLQKLRNQQEIRQNIISKNICVSIKQLAISGDDMIKLGYSGKQIREKLEFALEAVITGKANNSKEELLSILTRESLN